MPVIPAIKKCGGDEVKVIFGCKASSKVAWVIETPDSNKKGFFIEIRAYLMSYWANIDIEVGKNESLIFYIKILA